MTRKCKIYGIILFGRHLILYFQYIEWKILNKHRLFRGRTAKDFIKQNSKKLCHSKLEMMPHWASKTDIKGVHMGYILIFFQHRYKELLLILNCIGKNLTFLSFLVLKTISSAGANHWTMKLCWFTSAEELVMRTSFLLQITTTKITWERGVEGVVSSGYVNILAVIQPGN